MTQEALHTKGELLLSSSFLVCDEEARIVANCVPMDVPLLSIPPLQAQANAARIVKAWNSHDALVEALHNMIALAEPHFSDEPQMLALNIARAALKAAA